MDLTTSFLGSFPTRTLERYEFFETRNASSILAATNPIRFNQLVNVLDTFALLTSDLVESGGNESKLAARLNTAFREKGWREARVDQIIRLSLLKEPYKPSGENERVVVDTETTSLGYKVDNFVDRVALDVEWNAKDGNLDRDLAAYRSLYDAGLIDGAVMITRTVDDLRRLGARLGALENMPPEKANRILATSTTTNTTKLVPKLTRGDSGGCPMLVVAICEKTWDRNS
ncbi:MAG: BglII/BstYI family type II restriction endonuclease [Acidimicrobiales bacterium]